jgi:low temperature requirement protein LtrA
MLSGSLLSRVSPPTFWCERDGGEGGHSRRVTWVELFFDLVFVAAVAQVGSPLTEDYSFDGLARYTFLLFIIWWAWSGHAMYATRFDADDTWQRVLTLLQMIAVIFMAANAEEGLDTVSSAGFAAAYAVMRLILVLQYIRASTIAPARMLARTCARGFGAAACIWLASALVGDISDRLGDISVRYSLWGVAIALEVATAIRASRHVETLPPHASHLPERFGLFTLILLGDSIVALMKGIQAQPEWSPAAAGAAFSGICFTFAVWWAYFERARAAADRHVRTRRERRAYEIWTYVHVPLYLGLVLSAVGVEHIIRQGAAFHMHAEEAVILGGAVAAVVASLIVLYSVRATPAATVTAAGAATGAAAVADAARATSSSEVTGRRATSSSAEEGVATTDGEPAPIPMASSPTSASSMG